MPSTLEEIPVRTIDGKVIERFSPDVPPDAELITSSIERALAAS